MNCAGDYEKLRAISAEEKGNAYTQVVEKLRKEKDNFLLDSHYLTLIRGKVTNMITDRLKNFDALVLISTPIEVLWSRVQNDIRDRALFPTNTSPRETKKILADYQIQTLQEFNRAIKEYNLPGIHIQNDTDDPEKVAKELHKFILDLEKYSI